MDKMLLNEIEDFYSKPLYEYNLSEEFSQDEIDQLAADSIEGADKEDIQKLRNGEINEGLATATIIAMPALLKLGGKISNMVYQKLGLSKSESKEFKTLKKQIKDIKKKHGIKKLDNPLNDTPEENQARGHIKKIQKEIDEKFGSKLGNLLKTGGKKLHHLYTSPIKGLLYVLSLAAKKGSKLKDKKFREKVANLVYAGIMIFVAGSGIYHSMSHLHGLSDITTGVVESIEGEASIAEIISTLFDSANVSAELGETAAAADVVDVFQDN